MLPSPCSYESLCQLWVCCECCYELIHSCGTGVERLVWLLSCCRQTLRQDSKRLEHSCGLWAAAHATCTTLAHHGLVAATPAWHCLQPHGVTVSQCMIPTSVLLGSLLVCP